MKRTLILIAVLVCINLCGYSQNEAKKERIKYLFSLMHQDTLINKTFDAMSSSMTAQMTTMFQDSMYTQAGFKFEEHSEAIMKKVMEVSKANAKKLMSEDMVDIYDKYFASEDIENFIVFYSSASGQKMIAMLPETTKDIMSAMTAKYQPSIQQAIMKAVEEMMNESSKQQ
jgi:hypothetical protein